MQMIKFKIRLISGGIGRAVTNVVAERGIRRWNNLPAEPERTSRGRCTGRRGRSATLSTNLKKRPFIICR
jgi:hypothetical protein